MTYPHPEQTPMGWQPPTGTPSGQGPPPPPGAPPPPPPPAAPPRRRRRWPWVVLAVVLLLLAMVGGCSWLVFQAARPSIDAANEWLALVDEERWDEAYDALCPSTRERTTREEAVATLTGDFGAGIDAYRISQYQNTNGAVSVGGEVTVAGDERPISLAMAEGADGWRVCRYGFGGLDDSN